MRIAVAMSGGVDSSTAAALLLEQGHEVVGFTLKVWDRSRCCSLDDVEDARRVAARLGIPFYVLDAHDVFEREVVEPFTAEYASGRTPNPCVWCNRRVKFRWLVERVRPLGCELVATGHYARLEVSGGRVRLRKGVDPRKDQSYFLVPERPGDLERVRFPVGGLTKEQVRGRAEALGLPVSSKAESQDVCFLPDGDLAGFLERRLGPARPGPIVDPEGRVVGTHRGQWAYTVGQRRGLGISAAEPLYVVRREARENRLVVGPRSALLASEMEVEELVWLHGVMEEELECGVKIRSTAPEVRCIVRPGPGRARVRFAEPQFGVAPGQFAAFYRGDEVLGGGWIREARPDE
ncbi:tRNA 2-thiouridine(34) synthase MnmA [Deferrisoma camini]|uniref:tRNA 2-thiouridine(34) synthase MnmA n=1 Tax=Deferrisoma camini TaxID=1035120 RepID=UPI00046CAA38|nr:tRNA 2-thiouridine(34) synthase MnmA [Deferrisoma camini]